jgi:hypothetical protein
MKASSDDFYEIFSFLVKNKAHIDLQNDVNIFILLLYVKNQVIFIINLYFNL